MTPLLRNLPICTRLAQHRSEPQNMAGGSGKRPTAKQLQQQLLEAHQQLETVQQAQRENAAALEAATRQIQEQAAVLAAAQAEAGAARAQAEAVASAAAASTAASNTASQAGSHEAAELIPRPHVPRGQSLKIRASMGIDAKLYTAIRYRIHVLVHAARLSWQDDFRHQDVDKLTKVFNGAAKDFPILKRYCHHWATAAIASRYMQNVRRNARRNGHIPRRARFNRGGSNGRGRSASILDDGGEDDSRGEDSD
ncbi:hypothetical protein C2E23DRAFT_315378 [Lenzites betulinus]|nr:hypothetical protein C2E23DRAFT_315378 [Lenzites betulinus]